MKRPITALAILSCLFSACDSNQHQTVQDERSPQMIAFEDGNYAMFIHFGLYSKLEGVWKGKTYRGNAEWIMNRNQAGIPIDEYMAEATGFNPSEFDADAVAKLAKDAGMKYIVITSKHHEGFAMFDSDASEFNIKDATPLGRDLIGELADACHRNGIGIGFYYSQFQDWTAPGGGGGPKVDENGRSVDFEEYFRRKCVPQVEELTTKYGDIQCIWFDTPGNMDKRYSEELVELVHKNQPGCLVSSRVGNGLGDYETLGDMEIPVKNIDGRWEGIDVMQVGWGYSRDDAEWKSPRYVLVNLLSTVARGGTFMMNVGPDALGRIPEPVAQSLLAAGKWVEQYPQTVYGAGPSPWGHALQWGDAVTQGNTLYLLVYDWPRNGRLTVPGLSNRILSARIAGGRKLSVTSESDRYVLNVPEAAPDGMVSVIELRLDGPAEADGTFSLMDGYDNEISVAFAQAAGCKLHKHHWMTRFGEWKCSWRVTDLDMDSEVIWEVIVPESGWYDVDLDFMGEDSAAFSITDELGNVITNKQPAHDVFLWQRMGWMKFNTPGRHTLCLKVTDGFNGLSIRSIRISKVL